MYKTDWGFIDYEFRKTIKTKHIKLPRSTEIEVETSHIIKEQSKENTLSCLSFRMFCSDPMKNIIK